jgi:hypothetical protein
MSDIFRPAGSAFGPQKTLTPDRSSARSFCKKSYFLGDGLTSGLHGLRGSRLRNTSHLGHISALNLTFDHGYNAVSIRSRVIDKAFVYCKNLRCRG